MNVEDTQEYVVRLKKKAVYFPREIFDETETVVIDGRKVSGAGRYLYVPSEVLWGRLPGEGSG